MHSGYDVKKKKRDEEKDQNAAGVKVDAALADDEGKNSSGNAQGTGDGQNLAAVGELADAGQEETGNPAPLMTGNTKPVKMPDAVLVQNEAEGENLLEEETQEQDTDETQLTTDMQFEEGEEQTQNDRLTENEAELQEEDGQTAEEEMQPSEEANRQVMENLASFGMMYRTGKPLNVNSARAFDVISAIWHEPDNDRRIQMAEAFEKATHTKGNRFYGVPFEPETAGQYQETKELPAQLYNKFQEVLEDAFKADPEREGWNEENYQYLMEALNSDGFSEYQKTHLIRVMDKAYEKAAGHPYEAAENKVYAISAFGKGLSQEIDAPKEVKVSDSKDLPQAGTVNLTDDPVQAFVMARIGDGYLLDEATQKIVNDTLGKSPAARMLYGIDYTNFQTLTEQAENGDPTAVGQANSQLWQYLYGDKSSVIGGTLDEYLTLMEDKNFPDEYRDDLTGEILRFVLDAEADYEMRMDKDPEYQPENIYDAYGDMNPEALSELNKIREEAQAYQKEKELMAYEAAERARQEEAELLVTSCDAIKNGLHTQEDVNRVLESTPIITMTDMADNEEFMGFAAKIVESKMASYNSDEGWFNDKTKEYLAATGKELSMDSIVALNYKDMLEDFVKAELLKDQRLRIALRYESLTEFYDAHGGFSVEKLFARAAVSMQKLGSTEGLKYKGTGEDVSVAEVIGAGTLDGVADLAAEACEAIWTYRQVSEEERADLIAASINEAVEKYPLALSAWGREQEWRNYLATGVYPSEEYKQYVERVLDSNMSVFALGPVPETDDPLLELAVRFDRGREFLGEWAQTQLNETQGEMYERSSGQTKELSKEFLQTVISAWTRSPVLGYIAVEGIATYPQKVRKGLDSGAASLPEASAEAKMYMTGNIIVDILVNSKTLGELLSATGLPAAIEKAVKESGMVEAAQMLDGMANLLHMGGLKEVSKRLGKMLLFEPLGDTLSEQCIDGKIEGKQNEKNTLDLQSGEGIDIPEAIHKVLEDIPETFEATFPLLFLGNRITGWQGSVSAAQQLASTGSTRDARAFVNVFLAESENPQNVKALRTYCDNVLLGQMTASILTTDRVFLPAIEEANATWKKAEHYQNELNASMTELNTAMSDYDAKIEEVIAGIPGAGKEANGIYQEYLACQEKVSVNETEYRKYTGETNRIMQNTLSGARNKAMTEVEKYRRWMCGYRVA